MKHKTIVKFVETRWSKTNSLYVEVIPTSPRAPRTPEAIAKAIASAVVLSKSMAVSPVAHSALGLVEKNPTPTTSWAPHSNGKRGSIFVWILTHVYGLTFSVTDDVDNIYTVYLRRCEVPDSDELCYYDVMDAFTRYLPSFGYEFLMRFSEMNDAAMRATGLF